LIEGTPQGRQTGVAFSLVAFFLAKQKKVTSCRATPGGVDVGFAFDVGLREKAANPTYVLHPSIPQGERHMEEN